MTCDFESLRLLTRVSQRVLFFQEGCLRELVQLAIRGGCWIGYDSIAYDRSTA